MNLTQLVALAGLAFCGCHVTARSPYRDRIRFVDGLNYSATNQAGNGFDLYLPAHAVSPVPAAIFIHGGYWRNQKRSYYRAFTGLYENFGLALASRGIATAVIDYRTYPSGTIEQQYTDVRTAVAWLTAHAEEYGIDAKQICLVGHSAGGHLALMHAWQDKSSVKCVVALSPILDIAHMRQANDEAFNREITRPVFGEGEHDRQHSPLMLAHAQSVQTLLLYGEKDYSYLLEQAANARSHFGKQKAVVQIRILPDLDHSDMVLAVNKKNDPLSDVVAHYIKKEAGKGAP
ncbi:MAG: alpha/beta hydrolase [Turneriella sp.]